MLSVEEYELELDDRSIEADVDDLVEGEGELDPPGLKVCNATLLDVLEMTGVLVGEDSETTMTTCEVVAGRGMVSGS